MRTLWALLPFTRGRRSAMAGGLAGTLLVTVAELARPFPLKLVLDRLLVAGGPPLEVDARLVAGVAALVVAIAVVGAAGEYLTDAWMRRAGEHVVHDLRVALYAHLHRLSLRYHHRRHAGDLVTRLTGDVNAVGELMSESLVKVVGAVLLLVGMLAVSLALDPVLTLAAAAVTPVLAVATARARRAVKTSARRQRAAEGDIAALSSESLTAIETVKALGSESAGEERLRRRSDERRQAGVAGSAAEGRFGGLVDVLEAVGTGVVLAVGVARVAAGALTPGDLVVMHSYVRRLYRPIRDLARQAGRVARALSRAERIVEVLAADDTLPDRPGAFGHGRAAGALELRDVHFAYADRPPALRGVSLVVAAGTTVAVVGPSGAGKSTLAALLGRFHDPDSGSVLLDGRDLRACSLGWLRSQVAFVLQETALFSGTVAENIGYGTDASREQVVAAARAAGVHEFVAVLPEGYDTPLGPGGVGLSGGQRQRLAIARSLLRDPAVVLLDEPTTGLDAASERTVVASLERLLEGRTTVLVTHSLRLARRADQVVVLEGGRVVEQGSPRRLLAAPSRFRRLAATQGLAPSLRVPAPADPALPQLATLLDPDAVAEVLGRHLDGHHGVDRVSVRYVRYKPGTNAVVDYDVATSAGRSRAVLMVAADRDLARRATGRLGRALAAKVGDRAPGPQPLAFVPELSTLVQWLPLDVWLPALAEPPVELAARAGVMVDEAPECHLVAYKPRRRAVLRVDGHVLKLYADQAAFALAAAALLAGPRLPVRTASPAGLATDLLVTAQEVIDGRPVDDPVAAAAEAGGVLAALHGGRTRRALRRLDPMAAAAATAGTVGALVPPLHGRLERLLRRLHADAPRPEATLCHGDFHARQLLATDSGLALLDLDELGLGPPGGDLATYGAHLLDGTPAGVHRADEALELLIEGYGSRPADLGWHLSAATLRRAVFAFRTEPGSDWPERVEAMVETAEQFAGR